MSEFLKDAARDYTIRRLVCRIAPQEEYHETGRFYRHPQDCKDYMDLWARTLQEYWKYLDKNLKEKL